MTNPLPNNDEDRVLSVRDAAWLARVNDDTVRRWLRSDSYPSTAADADREHLTTWNDLATWLGSQRKSPPLPAMLLDLNYTEIADLLELRTEQKSTALAAVANKPTHSGSDEIGRLQEQVAIYRRIIREKIVGSTHSRADAAASDRAISSLLDEDELRQRNQ